MRSAPCGVSIVVNDRYLHGHQFQCAKHWNGIQPQAQEAILSSVSASLTITNRRLVQRQRQQAVQQVTGVAQSQQAALQALQRTQFSRALKPQAPWRSPQLDSFVRLLQQRELWHCLVALPPAMMLR